MRRAIVELLQYKYRAASDDSDSVEQIGGYDQPLVKRRATTQFYTDEQVEKALDLLGINSLPELAKQNFEAFDRKRSWVQLATGCVQRLARDLMLLRSLGETAERAGVLHQRLERRRELRVRTPNETQSAICVVRNLSKTVNAIWKLSRGEMVEDVDTAVSSGKVIMPSWRAVSALVPTVKARGDEVVEMVKRALAVVVRHPAPREGIKLVARRAMEGWEAGPAAPEGEQVTFSDSD